MCRSWHSETLTAIANGPEFPRNREKRIAKLVLQLSSILCIFVPQVDEEDFQATLRSSIIVPATSLAHKMHLSVDEYNLEWTAFHRLRIHDRIEQAEYLQSFELANVLIDGKVVKSKPEGARIEYIFDISPQLVLRAVKGEGYAERKVLKRSKVLVAVVREDEDWLRMLRYDSKQEPTLLGWLENVIYGSRQFHS